MNDVVINKKNGGLGRQAPSNIMISGLVISGIAIDDGVQLATPYTLNGVEDAEDLLIDQDYDDDTANSGANPKLLYYHITEFFRKNPNGVLWLYVVAQSNTLTEMCDITGSIAMAIHTASGYKLRQCAYGRNPVAAYTPTLTTGLDGDVITAIPKLQALYELLEAQYQGCAMVLEGRSFNGTIGSALDLSTKSATNVSVVIAADNDKSLSADAIVQAHAAIGTILGCISAADVNVDIAYVEQFNLQSDGLWINPGLSNGVKINTYVYADLSALDAKRYIFPRTFSEIEGVYWNDSHTCSVIADNDFAYIENNRTIDEAIRNVRTNVLPKLNAPLLVDPTTGQLQGVVCKMFENLARKALKGMQAAGELSGFDAYCNPNQNVLSTSTVAIVISLISTATGRLIDITIGFTNPLAAAA